MLKELKRRPNAKSLAPKKNYKLVESSPKNMPRPLAVMFCTASSKTQIEQEILLCPFTSLKAEFWGFLGLFLGFSFLTIWQKIRGYFCKWLGTLQKMPKQGNLDVDT